jgi:hypothetical protein
MTVAEMIEELDNKANQIDEGMARANEAMGKINILIDDVGNWLSWLSRTKLIPSLKSLKTWTIAFGVMFALQTLALVVIAIALVL